MSEQNGNAIVPSDWTMMQQQASALVASGFLPQSVSSPQKAVAIIMLGRELGIAPWAALTTINVIQGKPTVSPQLMLALINRSGQLEDLVIKSDDATCTVTMKRKGRTAHSYTFSDSDAESMGLLNKDNWRKQRPIMRQWRAVAGCARVVFADVILGLYTPDEMGVDVIADEQGNMTVIDVKPEPVTEIGHESDSVPTGAPSAKVVGVQPQRPTPPPASVAADPDSSGASGSGEASHDPLAQFGMEQGATVITATRPDDVDLDLYHCDRLKVNKTRTATQYILWVVKSATRIMVDDVTRLEGLTIGGEPIVELGAGEYPLVPMWSVRADSNGRSWTVRSIEAGIPVNGVTE